jgi:hypothetical protein
VKSIGSIEGEGYARSFGNFLYAKGIESQVDEASPGRWEVWGIGEDKLEAARQYLAEFRANPNAERFTQATLQSAERKVLQSGPVRRRPQVFTRGAVF